MNDNHKNDHIKVIDIQKTVIPKYKCIECGFIATATDIKQDIKCNNCRGRILVKLRTTGIEYVAR